MKKIKNTFKMVVVVVLIITGCIACEKSNEATVDETKTFNSDSQIQISLLKKHLSELTKARLEDISYDSKTEKFSIFGIEQISLEELTAFYNNAKDK